MPELILTHTAHNCRNLVSAQVWRVATAATCIFGFRLGLSLAYGLDFLLGALALESGTLPWLAIGSSVFASGIILFVKVKVLRGGFGLWLGTILLYCLW
jgi:hypothetical protein